MRWDGKYLFSTAAGERGRAAGRAAVGERERAGVCAATGERDRARVGVSIFAEHPFTSRPMGRYEL